MISKYFVDTLFYANIILHCLRKSNIKSRHVVTTNVFERVVSKCLDMLPCTKPKNKEKLL